MRLKVDGSDVEIGTGGRPFDPSRRTILFIHGAAMDHSVWMAQARAYAWSGWSVLAPDLPGHGRSGGGVLTTIPAMADWVFRVLDAAGVTAAAVVGHSMGGAIAIASAAKHPDRITHLGLIGTGAAIPVSPQLLEAARERTAEAYDMMTTWSLAPRSRIGGNPSPGLWLSGTTRALFDRNRPGTLAADLAACNDWTDGESAARSLHCPVVVVSADRDVMTPPRRSRDLAALISGARLVEIAGSGHMIMSESPVACTEALRTVIR